MIVRVRWGAVVACVAASMGHATAFGADVIRLPPCAGVTTIRLTPVLDQAVPISTVEGRTSVTGIVVLDCARARGVAVSRSNAGVARIRSPQTGALRERVRLPFATASALVPFGIATSIVGNPTTVTITATALDDALFPILSASASVDLTVLATPPGRYCGGISHAVRGLSIDLDRECRRLHGAGSSATLARRDAYGWVCRDGGNQDHEINMQALCRHRHGPRALAVLRGIGPGHWRCLRPRDVDGHVVPILLLPVDLVSRTHVAFVRRTLRQIHVLLAGARRFYGDYASTHISATNAFVLPTGVPAQEWQNLALATDPNHVPPKMTLDRYGYHHKVGDELEARRWKKLTDNTSAKIAAFVTLGPSFASPTWLGAASERTVLEDGVWTHGWFFSIDPLTSTAHCRRRLPNPPEYERAFYAVGHELGHILSLEHPDTYEPAILPPNWHASLMATGDGTHSVLFPNGVAQLARYLGVWP